MSLLNSCLAASCAALLSIYLAAPSMASTIDSRYLFTGSIGGPNGTDGRLFQATEPTLEFVTYNGAPGVGGSISVRNRPIAEVLAVSPTWGGTSQGSYRYNFVASNLAPNSPVQFRMQARFDLDSDFFGGYYTTVAQSTFSVFDLHAQYGFALGFRLENRVQPGPFIVPPIIRGPDLVTSEIYAQAGPVCLVSPMDCQEVGPYGMVVGSVESSFGGLPIRMVDGSTINHTLLQRTGDTVVGAFSGDFTVSFFGYANEFGRTEIDVEFGAAVLVVGLPDSEPSIATAFADPFFEISPDYLAANPGAVLTISNGVGNALPIPEPSTYLQLMFGILAIGAAAKMSQRTRKSFLPFR